MSAYIGISLGKPVDEKYKKFASVYQSCKEAGIQPPIEVRKFFGYEEPDGKTLWLNEDNIEDGVLSGEYYEKFIDLKKLPKDISIIRIRVEY